MASRVRHGRRDVLPGAPAAVRQIREKGYASQYKGDRRPVTLVGVNFRTAKRNIDEPLFATLKRDGLKFRYYGRQMNVDGIISRIRRGENPIIPVLKNGFRGTVGADFGIIYPQ